MKHARRRSRIAASVALGALAVITSGCGSSDDPGDSFADQGGRTIVRTAFDDTRGVKALRIRGTVKEKATEMTIDVRTDRAGRCAGTMSQGKGTSRFVVTKQAAFLKAEDAFWRDALGADADEFIATLDGRWLKSAPDPQISNLCRLGQEMVKEMDREFSGQKGTPNVGATTTVDGFEVVEVNDGGDTPDGSVLISVDAPHYIRQVIARTGPDQGVLTLSEFGATKPVQVPGPAAVYEVD